MLMYISISKDFYTLVLVSFLLESWSYDNNIQYFLYFVQPIWIFFQQTGSLRMPRDILLNLSKQPAGLLLCFSIYFIVLKT